MKVNELLYPIKFDIPDYMMPYAYGPLLSNSDQQPKIILNDSRPKTIVPLT